VQTDAGIWEEALANVLVPATSGVPTTITDRREYMGTRISMWTTALRPTGNFPYVGYNLDEQTYEGYDPVADEWGPIGGGGNVASDAIQPNSNEITEDYTFEANQNGVSAGPITIASGVTVTVGATSAWSIV
jgi:hypothetical protein